MSPLKKVWTCPECRRAYRISRTAHPDRCPACAAAPATADMRPEKRLVPTAPVMRKSYTGWVVAGFGVLMFLCAGGGVTALACLGILGRTPSGGTPRAAEDVYEQVKPAVVFIVMFDEQNNPIGTGSGFFVDRDGTVVTNYHVAAAPGTAAIALQRDDERIAVVTDLLAFDEAYDLAVFDSGLKNTPFVPLAPSTPRVGERVYAVGNPQGLTWSLSDGVVSSIRPWNDTRHPWVQTTTPISSGSSGGPLVDAVGRLVGATTGAKLAGSDGVAQNLNFATPAAAIKDLLDRPAGGIPIGRLTR